MDPSGSSSPLWSADPPTCSDQQASPSSQQSQRGIPYPMPVQVQMSYNHTAPDPTQIQPILESPFQIQQRRRQEPPSMSSLVNLELNIILETPEGSSSWTAAETPSYPDQQTSYSSLTSDWVEGSVQHHQQMVQPPGNSPYAMPVYANYIHQRPNEFREDMEAGNVNIDEGAYCHQSSSGSYQLMFGEVPLELVAAGQENRSYPLNDGNNSDETSSLDVDLLDAGSLEYAELRMNQEDPEVYQSDQHFVQCPLPINFNEQLNLDDNEPILYHSVFSHQLVANPQHPVQIDDLPNPQNSRVQVHEQNNNTSQQRDKIKVEQAGQKPPSNKTPVDYNSVRRAVRKRHLKDTPYQCPICKAFFTTACGRTQHQNSIHTERPFRCTKCGKTFASQAILDNHFKKHELEDKPFKCLLCDKQFCHKNDLRRHSYKHSGITPHQCVCSKYFSRNDHLLDHQKAKHCLEKKLKKNTKH